MNTMISISKNRVLIITLITVCILGLLFIPLHTKSETINDINPVIIEPEKKISNQDMLWKIGLEKGLQREQIILIEKVIFCESSWNPEILGDGGTSYGLVQIHLPAHPNISKEQALDPIFAINFIVDEFLNGNQNKWTCYRNLIK